MISAFGIDHGGISKSYTKNAARLAQAAEKGSAYAAKRVKAGERGLTKKPGFIGRTAGRLNSSAAYRAIPHAQAGGMARMEARVAEQLKNVNPGGVHGAAAAAGPKTALHQGKGVAARAQAAVAAPPAAAAVPQAGSAAAKTGMSPGKKSAVAGGIAVGSVGAGAGGAYAYNRNRGR